VEAREEELAGKKREGEVEARRLRLERLDVCPDTIIQALHCCLDLR
jgi:hypothetical protein